jgi:soluble lytic murein transglycosylase-like protein
MPNPIRWTSKMPRWGRHAFRALTGSALTLMLGVLLSVAPTPVRAAGMSGAIPWQDGAQPCWEAAGQYHHIDPWLLYAIAYVESRYDPQALGKNTNGSRDIGLMQINSTWIPELQRWGVPLAALTNACASTYIGAWIMAANFRRFGYSWEAIAAYNVGSLDTPRRRQLGYQYASKVYTDYNALIRPCSIFCCNGGCRCIKPTVLHSICCSGSPASVRMRKSRLFYTRWHAS